jgi:hypothetical protein
LDIVRSAVLQTTIGGELDKNLVRDFAKAYNRSYKERKVDR